MKLKLLVSGLLLGFCMTSQATTPPKLFKSLYVIGDSLSDQGNLLAATQVAGVPLALPPVPTPDHYHQGRFSNGEVYSGILAAKFGIALKPSAAGGTNFAYGGARTYYNRLEIPRGPYARALYPWSIDGQRQAFYNQALTQGIDKKGLFVVYSGSNDLADVMEVNADPATAIQNAVAGTILAVETFKAVGAKTVLVPNVVDLGQAPSVSRLGPVAVAAAGQLSRQFNAAQDQALNQVTGLNLIRFDSFRLLNDLLKRSSLFGFKNTQQPCFSGFVWPDPAATECAKPDEYLFWDIEHPTRKTHALLAQQMYLSVLQCQLLSPIPWLRGQTLQLDPYTRCTFAR